MCREYEHPNPSQLDILEGISSIKWGIQDSLRCGIIRKSWITIPCRHDVFRHIFSSTANNQYMQSDFSAPHFRSDWDVVYNSIGDGYKILYPIIMRPRLQWSRKYYEKNEDGKFVPKPRRFMEVVCMTVNKSRCD